MEEVGKTGALERMNGNRLLEEPTLATGQLSNGANWVGGLAGKGWQAISRYLMVREVSFLFSISFTKGS